MWKQSLSWNKRIRGLWVTSENILESYGVWLMCCNSKLIFIHVFFYMWSGAILGGYIWFSAATWDFQQCVMRDQQSLRSACAYAQSDHSLCLSLEYSMSVKLLTEHHLEFLSLRGGCIDSPESTLVKMPHCWNHMSRLMYTVFAEIWSYFRHDYKAL